MLTLTEPQHVGSAVKKYPACDVLVTVAIVTASALPDFGHSYVHFTQL